MRRSDVIGRDCSRYEPVAHRPLDVLRPAEVPAAARASAATPRTSSSVSAGCASSLGSDSTAAHASWRGTIGDVHPVLRRRSGARRSRRSDRRARCRRRPRRTRARSRAGTALTTADAAAAGHRVGAERDAGRARLDHALHEHRRRARRRRQAVLAAVREDPLAEARPPDRAHLVRHIARARRSGSSRAAGERVLGAVLVAGRRPHRHELAVRTQLAKRLPPARCATPGASGHAVDELAAARRHRRTLERRALLGVRLSANAAADRTNQAGTGSPARCARPAPAPCRRACGESAASAAAQDPRRSPRHHANASGTAPRPRYISSVQTPDISSIDLPRARRAARRTTRHAARRRRPATAPRAARASARAVPMRADAVPRGDSRSAPRRPATRARRRAPQSAL